jgi:transcriptional regulator with XRE-family HTH domain
MALKDLVAARLREARRLKKWSIARAAEEISVKPSTWGAWESGQNSIPLEMIEAAARVLEKPIEFFILANYEYTIKASLPEESPKKVQSKRSALKASAR